MITVDTHHVGGYVCELCGNEYEEQLANVVACADSQIFEFVEWILLSVMQQLEVLILMNLHIKIILNEEL